MATNRTLFGIWLFGSLVYLGFTAYAIHHAFTCMEMFCGIVIILPGLPWSYFGSGIFEHYDVSETTYAVATVVFALLNVAISYLILVKVPGLLRRGRDIKTDSRTSGRIFE